LPILQIVQMYYYFKGYTN